MHPDWATKRAGGSRGIGLVICGLLGACSGGGGGSGPSGEDEEPDLTPPAIGSIVVAVEGFQASISWETDEPSTGGVEYGKTTQYGQFLGSNNLEEDHSLVLEGLEEDTSYHFRVLAVDAAGNEAASSDQEFTVEAAPDETAPQISGLSVQPGPAEDEATIAWSTDEPATGRVEYGLTSAYGNSLFNPSFVTEHVFVLSDLVPGTTYHFRVASADEANNETVSDDGEFDQPSVGDQDPPVITNVRILTDSSGNAAVLWTTDEPATSKVEYGLTTSYGNIVEDSALVIEHTVILTGLTDGATYHCRVSSRDEAGNEAVSEDNEFEQGETGNDTTPPLISAVLVAVNGGNAVVTWTTDEPATSAVDYGLTASYGSTVDLGADLVTSHSVQLAGLTLDTQYHFRVRSSDARLNEAVGQDDTFHTGVPGGDADVTGELVAWYPVTLSFEGPVSHELATNPNPFLDYRLTVQVTGPSGQVHFIPGFFDGDGEGGAGGGIWRVRFAPDEGGLWSYEAHFDAGNEIAIDLDLNNGVGVNFDGASGVVSIAPRDPAAPGFYRHGLLEYTGGHYLKFRDGPYFLKGGTNSPENFLGYAGFDNTFDQPGGTDTSGLINGLHRYAPHVGDWGPSGLGDADDPLFGSADSGYGSRGIIGALNYLSSVHVNSVYFLPMNLEGDGRDTYPFTGASGSAFDKTHYDISKLAQWNLVFEHAQRKGILLHIVLAETEPGNEAYLDNGTLGVERKLFYRELVSRFGHCLAIKWDLSEETDFVVADLRAFAQYIRTLDPYRHPITFHTRNLPPSSSYAPYQEILGDTRFTMSAIQGDPEDVGYHTKIWRARTEEAGHQWVVEVDEMGPPLIGLTDTNHGDQRRAALYDVYFSGGGIEWYAGYHDLPLGGDLRMEDFRTRESMWNAMWYARRFVEQELPFWEMLPNKPLVQGEALDYGGAEVFIKPNDTYAVYFPSTTTTGTLDLTGTTGSFDKRWYDPRTGNFVGSTTTVAGGGVHAVGAPPTGFSSEDWVLLLER